MLTTVPNSAIPMGYRKRTSPIGDERLTAAGILFVAPDGRALFTRRSGSADHGGEWAFPGGVVEQDEEPHEAARREALEETGKLPGWELAPIDRNTSDDGVDFVTFGMPADAFIPRLNGEHDSHVWAPLDAPPEPLHPEVASMLARFFREEAQEPEHRGWETAELARRLESEANAADVGVHQPLIKGVNDEISDQEIKSIKIKFESGDEKIAATDSALMIAMDRESVRTVDPDGRLRVAKTHISKANISPYRGEEIPGYEELGLDPNKIYQLLRHPDELARAATSFNGVQLLRKHVPVNAEDHRAYDIVGTTGTDAVWNDPYLDNSLVIWAKDAIDDIESEEKREVSCGYHYRADMTPGSFDGKEYDGVMRDIVGNHVALVETGRAGPDVVVGDSMESLMSAKLPTKFANLALHSVLTVLPPLAKDAKIDLLPVFAPLTRKTFKAKDVKLALDTALKGKLAKDATLDDVTGLLDRLEHADNPKSLDESVSGPQHRAMAAAAQGEGNLDIPKNVGQEFLDKDKGKTFSDADPSENLSNFLKSKGMSDDDVRTACDMIYKKAADQKEHELEDGEKESDAEDPAKEKKVGDEFPDDKDKETGMDKGAKDSGAKDQAMVTKSAMDAAIKTATEQTAKAVRESVLKTQHEIRMALDEVRPFVGELRNDLAFDSADDVYREALKIKDPEFKLDGIHSSAFRPILTKGYPKAGAREASRDGGSSPRLGMDEAQTKSFNERYPDAARIGVA